LVRIHRHLIAGFIIALATSSFADLQWTTERTLPSGETIILHWVGEYEGQPTVHKITFPRNDGESYHIPVFGQPVFEASGYFVAFPYCADDGCANSVSVVNLRTQKLLDPIELSYTGQFEVECRWEGTTLHIVVSLPTGGEPPTRTEEHKFQYSKP
jgi:hypothetical protein